MRGNDDPCEHSDDSHDCHSLHDSSDLSHHSFDDALHYSNGVVGYFHERDGHDGKV